MELVDYFTDAEIIRQLCKERIKAAKSANDRQDIGRLMGDQVGASRPFINTILPPRKKWAAYRARNRTRVPDVDTAALTCATFDLLQARPVDPWVVNLRGFIQRIRERIFSDAPLTFGRPQITWENKEGRKYRPIACFSLEDNVINSLTAKYLRDFCDRAFEPSSYAFRARSDKGFMPTHHAAFEGIYALKTAGPDQDFYVAECDIRGFYDTVDHGVALETLQRVLEHASDCQA